jgi:SWI/SNF-related matrix-associated actin-dependent regulator of chromatin subfamily B protein 1
LPASVNLNPAVTRVSVVPLATSLAAIPPVSAEEVADVKTWMAKDRAYEGLYREMKTRMGAEFREMVGARNVPWWEKGTLDVNASRFLKGREVFDVRYPYRKKEREGGRRKGARREGIRLCVSFFFALHSSAYFTFSMQAAQNRPRGCEPAGTTRAHPSRV